MTKLSAALLVISVALLAFGVYRAVTAAQSQVQPICFTQQQRDHILEMSQRAIDDGFKNKVTDLFDVWIRDPTDQPRRAISGMQTNLSAYHRARNSIRIWDPAICN